MSRGKYAWVGMQFGRLVVLERLPGLRALCRCDCGTVKEVARSNLASGHTQSCGCLHREAMAKRLNAHGKVKTREYISWASMLWRCRNPASAAYAGYGGRGIKVCDRWRRSFTAFLEDMGERPGPGCSIDRIDNDGDYTPDNCRWATAKEQARNRRPTFWITIQGEKKSLAEWCEVYGRPYHRVWCRIRRRGWEPERALTTP